MISISIIIPAYNEEGTIIPLLKSVQEETNKMKTASFEIIMIDDYSQDKTNKCSKKIKLFTIILFQ